MSIHLCTLRVFAILLLSSASSLCRGEEKHDIAQAYRQIAKMMQAKGAVTLVEANYTWRNSDGTQPSRQELLSVWKANFDAVKTYSSLVFKIESFSSKQDKATAIVRRSAFYLLKGLNEEQIEVTRSRDSWERVHGKWRFVYREALPGSTTGRVLSTPSPLPDSPRLVALLRSVHAHHPSALSRFWNEVHGKSPLIEPLPNTTKEYRVTYLWQGGVGTTKVEMRGGLPSERAKPLARLPSTDVWYLTEHLPSDARFAYSLRVTAAVEKPAMRGELAQKVLAETYPPDPHNPKSINDGPYMELPNAPLQPWRIPMRGILKGLLSQEKLTSAFLKEERAITVYTPSGYSKEAEPCRLLVLFDGEDYQTLISTPTILDNLVAQKQIPPTIAVFVHSQGTRFRDLRYSVSFADFMAKELIPWARTRYRIRAGAESVIVGGLSLGGLMAGYCGLRHSEVFGNILSQSGAFWHGSPERNRSSSPISEDGWLAQQFATSQRLPLRFWLEVGRLEATSMVQNNRRIRDVLLAKGYSVMYSEFSGGHDYLSWRGSLANALIALSKD